MSRSRMFIAIGALFSAVAAGPAAAADMPGNFYLRGSLSSEPSQWAGYYVGVSVGYSKLNSDFSSSIPSFSLSSGANETGASFGGFIGYNTQEWDPSLVLGLELDYNWLSLETISTNSLGGVTGTASYKLIDYATFRGRAGYTIGQFLPYAFVGAAVGQVDYSATTTSGFNQSRDNAFPVGFATGVGLDVLLLPNVFLRGEWEYIAFSPVGGINTTVNTGRVGLGLRF